MIHAVAGSAVGVVAGVLILYAGPTAAGVWIGAAAAAVIMVDLACRVRGGVR